MVERTKPLLLVLLLTGFFSSNALANQSKTDRCPEDVTVIWARGSGQDENTREQAQALSYEDELTKRFPDSLELNFKQLDYPAVGVAHKGLRNTIEAKWSWPGRLIGGEFNQSVRAGVLELEYQIADAIVRCGVDHHIILGGYSQGANVIGDAIVEFGDSPFKKYIVYAGMFGDPKFDGSSYAARGAVKNEDNQYAYGALDAREEDFPIDYNGKVENWCRIGDGVCQMSYGDLFFNQPQHTDVYQHHEVPLAAYRAVKLLQEEFPGHDFDTTKPEIKDGILGKLDLMLVVDGRNFNSRKADIGTLNRHKDKIIRQARLLTTDVRLGIVGYHSHTKSCGSGQRFTHSPLSKDVFLFNAKLALFNNCGKTGVPNDALQKALSEEWRPDAKKIIVLISSMHAGSAGGRDSMLTPALDNAEALGVSIFPITPEYLNSPESRNVYRRIESTDGLPFWRRSSHNNAGLMMRDVLTTMAADRSIYEGKPYKAAPGEKVRFNLTGLHGIPSSEDVRYRWHFRGGTLHHETTTEPTALYEYENERSAIMARVELRCDSCNGKQFLIPVEISKDHVTPSAPEPPGDVEIEVSRQDSSGSIDGALAGLAGNQGVVEPKEPTRTIRMNWSAGPAVGGVKGYTVRHTDGSILGTTGPEQTSVTITDVPLDKVEGLQVSSLGSTAVSEPAEPQTITKEEPPDDTEDEADTDDSTDTDESNDDTSTDEADETDNGTEDVDETDDSNNTEDDSSSSETHRNDAPNSNTSNRDSTGVAYNDNAETHGTPVAQASTNHTQSTATSMESDSQTHNGNTARQPLGTIDSQQSATHGKVLPAFISTISSTPKYVLIIAIAAAAIITFHYKKPRPNQKQQTKPPR